MVPIGLFGAAPLGAQPFGSAGQEPTYPLRLPAKHFILHKFFKIKLRPRHLAYEPPAPPAPKLVPAKHTPRYFKHHAFFSPKFRPKHILFPPVKPISVLEKPAAHFHKPEAKKFWFSKFRPRHIFSALTLVFGNVDFFGAGMFGAGPFGAAGRSIGPTASWLQSRKRPRPWWPKWKRVKDPRRTHLLGFSPVTPPPVTITATMWAYGAGPWGGGSFGAAGQVLTPPPPFVPPPSPGTVFTPVPVLNPTRQFTPSLTRVRKTLQALGAGSAPPPIVFSPSPQVVALYSPWGPFGMGPFGFGPFGFGGTESSLSGQFAPSGPVVFGRQFLPPLTLPPGPTIITRPILPAQPPDVLLLVAGGNVLLVDGVDLLLLVE